MLTDVPPNIRTIMGLNPVTSHLRVLVLDFLSPKPWRV